MSEPWRAFDAAWFRRWQPLLLAILDEPILGRLARWVLCIRSTDIGYRGRILAILPHAYLVDLGDGTVQADIRTHPKYGKRVYYACRPFWWALHAWDWAVADRYMPALSAGFATLTQYPSVGGTTVDDWVDRQGVDETLAVLRTGAGVGAGGGDSALYVWLQASTTLNQYQRCIRSIATFDTSALGATASISSAELSVWGNGTNTTLGAMDLHVVAATPASNSAIAASDFANVGSVSFGSVANGSVNTSDSGYTAVTLNASGISNVSLTGISRFALRGSWDLLNSFTGSWASAAQAYLQFRSAEATGTANDPKLDVIYSLAGGARAAQMTWTGAIIVTGAL